MFPGSGRVSRLNPFDAVAERSVFQQVSDEYDEALQNGMPQSKLNAKFGCGAKLWFKGNFAPPYNKVKPQARDGLFRTYMFMSPTELTVRLERDHREHQFPREGETLNLIPNGSGYPILVLVEQVLLPPRQDPKTAILVIKQL